MTKLAEVAMPVTMRPCRFGWVMYPSTDQFVGGSYENYGEYSPIETRFLQAMLNPGDVVVAAGANIGSLVIPMAQKVGPQGKVIAFEPQGFIWSLLKANLAINGLKNVDAVYAAVGKECGTVKIPMYNYSSENNYSGLGKEQWKQYEDKACSNVDLVTVDSLNLPRLDMLQADVELMEKEVLEGAAETIKKFRPKMFIENDKEEGFVELIEYIRGIGYIPYWVATWLHVEDNYFESEKNIFPAACSFNMYCIPEERPEWKVLGLRVAETTHPPASFPGSWVISKIERVNA